ncbi:hypothetical protein GCM10027598_30640 [Amycolatopsis oliviviridis]
MARGRYRHVPKYMKAPFLAPGARKGAFMYCKQVGNPHRLARVTGGPHVRRRRVDPAMETFTRMR